MSDISKYKTVETKGWSHPLSEKLFATKEQADYDWAIYILRGRVTDCTTYSEFDIDTLIGRIPKDEDLRNAFSILGMFMINYPR